ncbi:DUF58 domain-containing protein [Microbacterium sediminicola]|uniref:DUF58 domain-containing protein n=1 Tax=Microbacterium sediminicola TaxID=415210 RepID=A0ABN2I3A9_9MICO
MSDPTEHTPRHGNALDAHTRTRLDTARGGTTLALRSASAWHRFRAAVTIAARWVAATVRAGGWIALVAAAVALPLGIVFGIGELVAAGLLGLALIILALPFLARARPYTVGFALTHDRVVAGAGARVSVTVTSTAATLTLPGIIDLPIGHDAAQGIVELDIPLLRRGAQHVAHIEIPTPRRGIVPIGPLSAVRGDPLGLLRHEATWTQVRTLYVHPRTVALPPTSAGFIRDLEGSPSAALSDADISFHAIREYAPGDAQHHVHWKSTAKTGTLMVRQYEQTRRSRMVIALDTDRAAYRDDEEFELAVSAAASLGVRGLRDGRDVDVTVGDEVPEFARSRMRAIRELSTVTPRILLDGLSGVSLRESVNPLADVAGLAVEAHPDASLAFLVCGSTTTATALQRAALAFPSHLGVAAIVCDLEGEPRLRRLGDAQVVTIGLLDDLRQLLGRGAQS